MQPEPERHLPARWRLYLLINLIYILPVVLIAADVVLAPYRFHALIAFSGLAGVIQMWRGTSAAALGFETLPSRPALAWLVVPLTLVAVLDLGLGFGQRQAPVESLGFLAFFVLVSAPAQEFLYRSFLFAELDAHGVASPVAKIVVSAGLFAFMHVIFFDAVTVGLTFAIGLAWAVAFQMTRSFWVVAASHAALGVFALHRGII